MTLDVTMRGFLDELIDNSVNNLTDTVKIFNTPKLTEQLLDIKMTDFIIALVIAVIHASFVTVFSSIHGRDLDQQEFSEVGNIILNRRDDIRLGILNLIIGTMDDNK